jgi:CheY-like chemotaxis protein/HPt (histidine-containing phosphotransfer) domain-containing protein
MILLAEDNAVNQKVATRILEKKGNQVEIAQDGAQAVEIYLQQTFDVILMDIQMPNLNGFEATAKIREMEKASGTHIPIIAMTAHVMKGDRERCLEAGMDDYVSKPIDVKLLFQALERSVAGKEPVALRGDSNLPEPEAGSLLLDRDYLLSRMDGDAKLLGDLARLFLEDYPHILAEARKALQRLDHQSLRMAAHRLRGAVSNFGATRAVFEAQKLEDLAEQKSLSGASSLLVSLEKEINRLAPALSALDKAN